MIEAKSLKYVKCKIILSNISVEDLPKKDLIGKCDLYVLLRLGNDEKQTSVAKNTLNYFYEGEEYEMIYDPNIMKGDGNVTLEILPALQYELDFELYLQPKPDKKKDKSKLKANLAQSQPDKNNGIINLTMIYKPEKKQQEKDEEKKPKQKDYDSDSNSEDKSGDNEEEDESDPDSKNKSKKEPKKMKYDENDSKYIKGVVKIRNVKV
ncbi:MAG: hypothetical protein EZS28_001260 [Streblomastix strix]|uniref:C2 domain-containing protein n=1 Tax=Streblomastix strix TaxID=222440 RepID=A0A5J4X7K5_9EUKA|nr:MAG: hypothetical protein EZS28_001260 [Streblomastix strix]